MTNVDRGRVEILMVEDNDADVRLFQTLMSGFFHLTVSKTGAEALDRLYQRAAFLESPRPDVVVLDLNVPILNGQEVLNIIKSDSSLRSIPVVVFSGGENINEIRKAYESGACAYLVKRSDLHETQAAFTAFAEFWIKQVVYPNASRPLQAAAEKSDTGKRPGQ
jgi:CheY-like chemotaxis protein